MKGDKKTSPDDGNRQGSGDAVPVGGMIMVTVYPWRPATARGIGGAS